MTKRTPENIARVRQLAAEGRIAKEIAAAIGVAPSCVAKWAKWAGIKLPTRSQAQIIRFSDPAKRAHLSRAGRSAGRPAKSEIVPGWVPRNLHDDYVDFAELYGEEIAARRVSAMKAEAARC